MTTVQALIQQAKQLIIDGKLDEAEQIKKQAEALKSIEALEVKPQVNEAARLPFAPAAPDAGNPVNTVQDMAVKSWFVKSQGEDLAGDTDLVLRDLYGNDYRQLLYAKHRDFLRYIKTGVADPQLHRLVLYTPDHILDAISNGMSVSDIKATQVESQDTLGGYLVPPDMQNRMINRLQGMTVMRSIAETITTMRDRVSMPVGTGGDDRYTGAVRVYKVDEQPTATQAETNATFGNVTIPVHTIMGHVAISKNVLEDSSGVNSIAPYLERQFATAYAVFEDEQFIIGNGVGGPQGILIDGTTGGPHTFNYGTIDTVNSGNATALTGDGVRNLPYAVASQYRQAGGAWLMSRGSVRAVKSLKTGSGDYLWADRNQQLQEGQPTKLEGYPILESEVLASPTSKSVTTYTANVYPIIFLTRGSYLIVDRAGGLDVTRYDDSTTGKGNNIVLVMRRRVGGQVILPWGISTQKVSA